MVDKFVTAPTLDSETMVIWVHLVATYKIRQCASFRRAEGLLPASHRRFEEHCPVFVSVGDVDDCFRQCLCRFEALLLVLLGDRDQGVSPKLLGSPYFAVRNG